MLTRIIQGVSVLGLAAVITACASPVVTMPPTSAPTILPTVAAPTSAPTILPTVAAPTLTAIPSAVVDTAAIDAFVTEMLAAYDVPGAAIAIVLPDGSTYARGYGVRDTTSGAAVTADTQFAIASSTKSFTALGIMLLVEEGLVDLDAQVTAYLPDFRLSDPEMTPKLTVRHLLMHASGMERTHLATANAAITRDEIVALAATTPMFAAPGEQHQYSNVNTVIAARIIETVSGKSWEAFTQERILTPLGMDGVTLNTAEMQQQADFALPHELDLLIGMTPVAFLEPGAEAPAAAVNASANQLLPYLRFQLGDGSINGARLLSAEALGEMHREQIAIEDTGPVSESAWRAAQQGIPAPTSLTDEYGYGFYWYTEQFQGYRVAQHDGHGIGFTANLSLAPDADVGVAVMANATYAFGFTEAVRSFILEELLQIPHQYDLFAVMEAQLALAGRDQASVRAPAEAVRNYQANPEQLAQLAGSYTNLMGDKPVEITVEGAGLRMNAEAMGVVLDVTLLPYADDSFLINTAPFRGLPVQFSADENSTTLILQGQPFAQR